MERRLSRDVDALVKVGDLGGIFGAGFLRRHVEIDVDVETVEVKDGSYIITVMSRWTPGSVECVI